MSRLGIWTGATGEEVVALLRDLVAADGKTLIVVTHDDQISDMADFAFEIRNG